MKEDSEFGTKNYASYCNKFGDKKLRTLKITKKVFTSIKIFYKVLCHVFSRNTALREKQKLL